MVTFWGTRRVCLSGSKEKSSSRVIYLDQKWGVKAGTDAWVTIRGLYDDDSNTARMIRHISKSGSGVRFVVDKNLGLNEGDWAVFSITPTDKVESTSGDDDDAGVGTEEGTEGTS